MLTLHAKTFYNTKGIDWGDEHYFYITPGWEVGVGTSNRIYLTFTYGGVGWTLREGNVTHENGLLFGGLLGGSFTLKAYLHKHIHSALENAELFMETNVSYWGSFPSGYKSVDWHAQLRNTHVELSSVTN